MPGRETSALPWLACAEDEVTAGAEDDVAAGGAEEDVAAGGAGIG